MDFLKITSKRLQFQTFKREQEKPGCLLLFIPALLRYNWCIIWSYLEHWKQSAKNKSVKSIF